MGWFGTPPRDPRRAAFEAEALPHADSLYGAALRLTRDPSDADDLVQEAFLRGYRFYDRFEAGTNMKAWLLRILTNVFINRFRRSSKERSVLEGEDADPIGDGVMSRAAMRGLTDPHGEAQRRLIAAEIQRALNALPEDFRLVVLLADVEELSYREIAEVAGCPVGTVMSRLHRARRLMQSQLVAQAEQLGIVAPAANEPPDPATRPPDDQEGAPAPAGSDRSQGEARTTPVSLDDYRRRRAEKRDDSSNAATAGPSRPVAAGVDDGEGAG